MGHSGYPRVLENLTVNDPALGAISVEGGRDGKSRSMSKRGLVYEFHVIN